MSEFTPQKRIRIVGKSGDTRPYVLQVFDAETGEALSNVCRVELILDVEERHNVAQVTYYVTDEQGHVLRDLHSVTGTMKQTATTQNPEVDVTALLVNEKHDES